MTTTTVTSPRERPISRRAAYAGLTAALIASIVLETVTHGVGYWQIALFALAPDLALVYGAAQGLAKTQLHPRAVSAYNLLHRFWGPIALAALTGLGWLPLGFFVGALAWATHVSLDRALGYGLRTRDGFQRP
jgi:hypothetical protein